MEENEGFALVLELVDPSAVAEITQSGSIPSFPHSCKPELRQKAAIMGSGPGEVWSGPDETVEIRRRRQPLQLVRRTRSTMGLPLLLLRGEELRSLDCAFSFETSSRSAAISFCTPADPGSSFDSLAGAARTGGERKEASTAGEGWRPTTRPRAGRRSNDGLDGASVRPAFAIRRTPQTPGGSKRPRNP